MLGLGALAVVSAGVLAQSRPAAVTARSLRAAPAAEWLTYGRDYAETHYSPLTQISTSTVAGLTRAWSTELGTPGTLETTPLVSNGVLYATGPVEHGVRHGRAHRRHEVDVGSEAARPPAARVCAAAR